MAEQNYQKLPPGWDCKYDQATGNCYYINYFTKVMQLEDPRSRYKQLQNERCSTESIPMQHLVTQPNTSASSGVGVGVGSSSAASPYHVYPSNSLTAIRAFQERNNLHSSHNISTSPLLTSSRGHLDMGSPLPYQRAMHAQTRRQTIQETSFTNPIDTDAVVAKIQNMFPTAGENHIRLLLKRYYNREAVVISALQVEKHPVTMPGPYVTPPAQRHLYHSNSTFYMTPPARRLDMGASLAGSGGVLFNSRTASPIPGVGVRFGSAMSMQSGSGKAGGGADAATAAYHIPNVGGGAGLMGLYHGSPRFMHEMWRSSPKPHSSPKMKLRYMKNIFPKADETLLLDILANADNNVQTASEKLISLGYMKRDFIAPRANNRPPVGPDGKQLKNKAADAAQHIPLRPKEYTQQEKETMQKLLKEKYPNIAERIILMALESVNYAEDRAMQILQIVQQEDEQRDKTQQQQQPRSHLHGAARSQSMCLPEESETDTATHADSILTVVLETSKDTTNQQQQQQQQQEKHNLPIINVTTPTTATTQIILSNSPLTEVTAALTNNNNNNTNTNENSTKQLASDNDNANVNDDNEDDNISPTNSSITSVQSSSQFHYSSTRYERLTTKSMLGSSSCTGSGITGYLQGSCNSFSLKSLTTSTTTTTKRPSTSTKSSTSPSMSNSSITNAAPIERTRSKFESLKNSQRSTEDSDEIDSQQTEFKSIIERMSTLGHNPALAKGPNEDLLLADYVTWNGANPSNSIGNRHVANGPNTNLISERSYKAVGRNPELCKGAKAGLAKGSIYAQLAATTSNSSASNIKCN